jgi:hypothetical protein
MPTLYIHTTETSSGGEPESDDRWCHHSDIVKAVSFNSVSRKRSDGFWPSGDSFEVSEEVYKAPKVFLVIVRYFDGGTFGRTCGCWHIQGSFTTEKEALALAASIRDRSYEKEWEKQHKKGYHYLPWQGYFSGLEGVEVHCFPVQDEPVNSSVIYH